MKETLLIMLMFWNLENYFDPFPPNEIKFWNWKKFEKKRDDIAKVIMLAKEEYSCFPAIIGVCEVENYFVLYQLTQNTPLARIGYGIIHNDSPDKRGIDVALLYRKEIFRPIETKFFPLFSDTTKKETLKTRLILYAKGCVNNLDTLEVQVEVDEKFFSDKISELENLTKKIAHVIQQAIGLAVKVKLVEPKTIERSMGKAVHVIDKRKLV